MIWAVRCRALFDNWRIGLNSELCQQALEKVRNPNVLVNLVSQRVRQLSSSGGEGSRPLVTDTVAIGLADVALREIIEGKLGWDFLETIEQPDKPRRKRRTP